MRLCLVLLALQFQAPATPTIDALIKEIEAVRAALTPPAPAPATVIVTTAAELQAALDGPAVVVQVQPGTYSGNFTVKAKPTITRVQGLTVTGRAAPGLAYPKLTAKDPATPVLNALPGAHDYTFVGVEFTGAAIDHDTIVIGPIDQTDAATMPQRVTFDQCYIHGVNGKGHRGVMMNAVAVTISRSYLAEFVEQGRDSQGIGSDFGGPYTIVDNYVEASGENIMFGGTDPKIVNASPGPALVSGNLLFKPPSWKTLYPGSVKNLFEIKNGHDITVTRNVLDGVWTDGQAGSALLVTVRNQDGGCPWCTVTNVTVSCNEFRNVSNYAVNILGTDNQHPSGIADKLTIATNLFPAGASGGVLVSGGPTHLTITGNVMPGLTGAFLALSSGQTLTGFVMTGNQVSPGQYGITGDGTGLGTIALEARAPGYVFTGNTIETTPVRGIGYPPGNTLVAPGTVTAVLWKCP
jgi:hypothetical protein